MAESINKISSIMIKVVLLSTFLFSFSFVYTNKLLSLLEHRPFLIPNSEIVKSMKRKETKVPSSEYKNKFYSPTFPFPTHPSTLSAIKSP